MTNGLIITAVMLIFMKDILSTLIHSIFKYILNPAVWLRQHTDAPIAANTQSTSVGNMTDRRDEHVTLALRLATDQIRLCENLSNRILPSGVEVMSRTTTVQAAVMPAEDLMLPDGVASQRVDGQTEPQQEPILEPESEPEVKTEPSNLETNSITNTITSEDVVDIIQSQILPTDTIDTS